MVSLLEVCFGRFGRSAEGTGSKALDDVFVEQQICANEWDDADHHPGKLGADVDAVLLGEQQQTRGYSPGVRALAVAGCGRGCSRRR
jgi:hypothetical protein